MRYSLLLTTLLFISGCTSAPQAKNAPCHIFAHHISRVPADIRLDSTKSLEGEKYYFYQLVAPFAVADGVTLPVKTKFAATMPFNWCKFHTFKLVRLPGMISWFPAQGVVMPDKKHCYFSMLVIPKSAKLVKGSCSAAEGASEGKTVVRTRK